MVLCCNYQYQQAHLLCVHNIIIQQAPCYKVWVRRHIQQWYTKVASSPSHCVMVAASPSHYVMVEVNLTSNLTNNWLCMLHVTSCATATNTVHVTSNLHKSDKFRRIAAQRAAECPCCVRGTYVLCPCISVLSAAYHKAIDLQSHQSQSQRRSSVPQLLI